MYKITTKELLSKITMETNGKCSCKDNKTFIIDFYSTWCNPCKTQDIVLNELSKETEDVEFYKVNVEEEYELAELFNIRNLPTILICGKETKRFSGFTKKQKLKDELKSINSIINIL